jgi:hypothetical protein
MTGSRFTEEQIIGVLREQEDGAKRADVCANMGSAWKLRDECLNETLFSSVRHARAVRAKNYSEVRTHSSLGGRTPASISVAPCLPASRPLRVASGNGLRPALTRAARDATGDFGRGGETALNQTEKHRQDGPAGNRDRYF